MTCSVSLSTLMSEPRDTIEVFEIPIVRLTNGNVEKSTELLRSGLSPLNKTNDLPHIEM